MLQARGRHRLGPSWRPCSPGHITARVLEALADTPVVLLHGPRQCGTSTLAQHIAQQHHASRYITLGARDFRGFERLRDLVGDDLICGVVLHTGRDTVAFGERLHALPISALWVPGASTARGGAHQGG